MTIALAIFLGLQVGFAIGMWFGVNAGKDPPPVQRNSHAPPQRNPTAPPGEKPEIPRNPPARAT